MTKVKRNEMKKQTHLFIKNFRFHFLMLSFHPTSSHFTPLSFCHINLKIMLLFLALAIFFSFNSAVLELPFQTRVRMRIRFLIELFSFFSSAHVIIYPEQRVNQSWNKEINVHAHAHNLEEQHRLHLG